jgi:methanogenic corrinoid protein MtbC1
MHRIGSDWETGKIDVFHEHRATHLCIGALHELHLSVETQARRDRPIAVGGSLEGDYSELPTLLAQMVLHEAGWDAVNIGAITPLVSFRRAVDELRPKMAWISVSHVADEKEFLKRYNQFYRHAEQAGVPVVVGGRGLTEALRSQISYTAYGDGLSHLAAFARTLLPPTRRPRRGRPPQS